MKAIPDGCSLVVFDGVCVLCNASVRFILKYEKEPQLYFAIFESVHLKDFASKVQLQLNADSVVLIENGNVFTESDAALRIARRLRYWSVLYYLFIWWPPVIRNSIYRFVAKRRYSWFGTQEHCSVPTSENRHRFFI